MMKMNSLTFAQRRLELLEGTLEELDARIELNDEQQKERRAAWRGIRRWRAIIERRSIGETK